MTDNTENTTGIELQLLGNTLRRRGPFSAKDQALIQIQALAHGNPRTDANNWPDLPFKGDPATIWETAATDPYLQRAGNQEKSPGSEPTSGQRKKTKRTIIK